MKSDNKLEIDVSKFECQVKGCKVPQKDIAAALGHSHSYLSGIKKQGWISKWDAITIHEKFKIDPSTYLVGESLALEPLTIADAKQKKADVLTRINVGVTQDLLDYIEYMSRFCGMSKSDFVNSVVKAHMDAHLEDYGLIKVWLGNMDKPGEIPINAPTVQNGTAVKSEKLITEPQKAYYKSLCYQLGRPIPADLDSKLRYQAGSEIAEMINEINTKEDCDGNI